MPLLPLVRHCVLIPSTVHEHYGPPSKAVVYYDEQYGRLNLWKTALFVLGYECSPPVASSDFDRLVSGRRLTHTVLLGRLRTVVFVPKIRGCCLEGVYSSLRTAPACWDQVVGIIEQDMLCAIN